MSLKMRFKLFKKNICKWITYKIVEKLDPIDTLGCLFNMDILTDEEVNKLDFSLNSRVFFIKVNTTSFSKPKKTVFKIKTKKRPNL